MGRPRLATLKPEQDLIKGRRQRADAAEITLPPVATPLERQKALDDPIFFVEYCCGCALKHKIPPALQEFVLGAVESAKKGGTSLVVLPRGTGKTTLLSCALLYCIVKRLVRFPVAVGANQAAANQILRNILAIIENSPQMLECFPELAYPIRECEGRWQRASLQHIKGVRTNVRFNADRIHLPDIGTNRGATIVARGAGSSVRGLVDTDGSRPDWVIGDDLQKASTARSETQLDRLEKYLLEDIRGLSGSDTPLAVYIAATPLAPNDIVDRLSRRPDVRTVRKPLVSSWPKNTKLWDEWTQKYYADVAGNTSTATEFYAANRAEMDVGAEVLDPLAYPPTMLSALERAYSLKAQMGEQAFRQEYLLEVPKLSKSLALDAAEVSKRLSNVPRYIVPSECKALVASIDVGTATAIHVAVVAYGPGQIASVIDAYRFPERGRLLDKNLPEPQLDAMLTKALVGVIANLTAPGRYRTEATGKPMPITAIAVDRGYRTQVVDNVARYFQRKRINVCPCKGVSNGYYRPTKQTIGKADNIDCREYDGVRWYGYNADVLKLQVLTAFQGEPMTRGSLSLFGSDPAAVYPIAQEIAGEQLLEILTGHYGQTYRWAPSSVGVGNHYLDTLVLNLGMATWLRFRSAESVESMVSTEQKPKAETEKPENKAVQLLGRHLHKRPKIRIKR